MKIQFLLFSILFSFTGFCQPGYWFKKRTGASTPFLFSKIDTATCFGNIHSSIFARGEDFFIIGDTVCQNTFYKTYSNKIYKYYIVVYENSVYYIESDVLNNNKSIDSSLLIIKSAYPNLSERITKAKLEFKEALKQLEEILRQRLINEEKENKEFESRIKKEEDSLFREYEKYLIKARSKDFVLWQWSWSYGNQYSSSADVWLKVLNPYKKKIKYISFAIRAYNDVDDLIKENITGKVEITLKGIGPIEYGSNAEYSFENAFLSKVIAKMEIKQIKIQFFDGTIKIINNPVAFGNK